MYSQIYSQIERHTIIIILFYPFDAEPLTLFLLKYLLYAYIALVQFHLQINNLFSVSLSDYFNFFLYQYFHIVEGSDICIFSKSV